MDNPLQNNINNININNNIEENNIQINNDSNEIKNDKNLNKGLFDNLNPVPLQNHEK